MIYRCAPLLLALISFALPATLIADETAPAEVGKVFYQQKVTPFLTQYCGACHGADTQEGDLRLDTLDPDMTNISAARWAFVVEKLQTGKMPPEDEKQPSSAETAAIIQWVKAEMKRAGKHLARREAYDNGNKVPHELLFGLAAKASEPAPTGARRLSPEIYAAFTGDTAKRLEGVSQPFSPAGKKTFKDMGAPKVDEPTTQSLIRNALLIADYLTSHKMEKGKAVKDRSGRKEYMRLFDTDSPATDDEIAAAMQSHFQHVLRRQATDEELQKFTALMKRNIKEAGRETGVKYTLATVFLMPEAVFRWETGGAATGDRVRLTPREIAFALAYALGDRRPENWLLDEAEKGKLDTQEGVQAAVKKMLENEKFAKPRIMRFFHEYFEYPKAKTVFKDTKEHQNHDVNNLIADTDKLIETILEEDKNVLRELLTTNRTFVAHRVADDLLKKRKAEREKFEREKKKNPEKYKGKTPRRIGRSTYEAYNLDNFPTKQPVELPAKERAGILTQPAWLVAWSKSDENDAIHRGKWVRERLLGGVVPDIPITVDAQLPETPAHTLRHRMKVTTVKYCWQCHTYMNRVGLPFEAYDHLGRYRETEPVLDIEATAKNVDKKGKPLGPVMKPVPVDATGGFEHVPDSSLSGDVNNAVEMLHKMAKSEYVEQVFVRHAFRYWMGRNETPGDAQSLQAAHRAYRESGGSMQALITAIVSSDAFLYRTRPND